MDIGRESRRMMQWRQRANAAGAMTGSLTWTSEVSLTTSTMRWRAVGKYTQCRWILLYIERWLKAPVKMEDGTLWPREKGTPQGGVISPLLANIFLHFAFDTWMRKTHPDVPFERYADDMVAHCRTEKQ